MAIVKLRLENPQQLAELERHLKENVSGVMIRPDVHEGYTHMDGHHVQVEGGDPHKIQEVMHHHFTSIGHPDWQTRFDVKHW